MINYVGIDYSMTSPAVCVITEDGKVECYAFNADYRGDDRLTCKLLNGGSFKVRVLENPTKFDFPIKRFAMLAETVMSNAIPFSGDTRVYIEDYSMASKGMVFHIAENTAILKYKLYEKGIEVKVVAPTTIKKFATGYGRNKTKDHPRGSKGDMYDQFVIDTGIDLQELMTPKRKKIGSPVNDIIDAYYIARYCKEKNT